MYHINKFFKGELSVVLHAIDDEYDKYIANNKKDQDDFERDIEDLDDFLIGE